MNEWMNEMIWYDMKWNEINECMHAWMNEWRMEWDEWTNEGMNEWMNEWTNEWMNGWNETNECMERDEWRNDI